MTLEQYRTRRSHDGYFAMVVAVLVFTVLLGGFPRGAQMAGLLTIAIVFFSVTFLRIGHDLRHTDPVDVLLARAESEESYAAWHFRISTALVPLLARVTPQRSRFLHRCCICCVLGTLAVIAVHFAQLSKTPVPLSAYLAGGALFAFMVADILVSGPWRADQARQSASRLIQEANGLRDEPLVR